MELSTKRLMDLERQAYSRNIATFSEFLTLNEQDEFLKSPVGLYKLDGGFELAERKVIIFLPYEGCEYDNPIQCIKVMPTNLKFTSMPSHRDFLGAVLGLGITRTLIGDILVNDNAAYIFCHRKISAFILDNLTSVARSLVNTSIYDGTFDETFLKKELISTTVSSIRLDSICAAAFSISRNHISDLITGGNVYVNGRLITTNAYNLKEDDIISVRHVGKCAYKGSSHITKKGKNSIIIEKYI